MIGELIEFNWTEQKLQNTRLYYSIVVENMKM